MTEELIRILRAGEEHPDLASILRKHAISLHG